MIILQSTTTIATVTSSSFLRSNLTLHDTTTRYMYILHIINNSIESTDIWNSSLTHIINLPHQNWNYTYLRKWIFTTAGCKNTVCCIERARGKYGWNRKEDILFVRPSMLPASGPSILLLTSVHASNQTHKSLNKLDITCLKNWERKEITWLNFKFKDMGLPSRNELDRMVCWLSMPISCRN